MYMVICIICEYKIYRIVKKNTKKNLLNILSEKEIDKDTSNSYCLFIHCYSSK